MNMDCKSNFDTKESDVYPVEVVDNDTNTRVNEEEHKISENTTAGEIPADKGTIVDDLDELYLLNESSQIQFMEESEEDEQNATSSSPMHSQKERSERLDDYLMEPDDTDFDTVNTITQIEGAVEDLSPISFHNRSDNGNSSGVIKENTEPPQPVEPLPDENSQKSNSEAEREKSNAVSDHQPADTTFLNPQLEQSQSHDKESDDEDFDMHSQYSIENYHMNRKEELLFTQTVPTQLSDTDDNEYPIGTKLPEIIALETQYYPLDHEEFDTQPNQLENSNLNQKEIDPESHSHDMLCTQLEQETYGEDYWKGDRSDFSDESRAKLPEYDNDLSDESYIQITTPAYKRMTESLENAHNEATDEIVDMDLDDQDSQSSLREANIHTLQSDYPIFDVESNSQDSDGDREIDKFFSIFAHLNDSASESSSYSEPDTEQEALQDVIEPIQEFSKKDYIDDDHDSEVDELESAILKRHSDMRKSISSVVNDEENDEDEEVLIPEENGTEQSHISVDDDDRQADKSKIDIEEDSNSINSNNRFERNSNYEEVECCNEDKSIYTRGLNVIEEYPCVLLANSTADSVSHHTHSEESENSMTPTLKRIWSKNAKDIAVLDEKIQHGCWTNLRKSWSQYIIPDHESESVIADDYHESSEVEVHQANDFSVDKAGEEIDSHWAPAGDEIEDQYQMIDVEDTQQDEPLHLNDLEGYEDNGNQIEEEDYSELEINLELESEDFGCYSNIDMVSNQRERNMQSSSNEIDEEESADSDKRVSLDELKDEMSPPRTIMESIRRSITPRNVTLSPATGGKETSLSFGCSSSLGGKNAGDSGKR
ncbi:hypothetical protein BC833DRAFT_316432 [Globomyces pollinis-pini]|nr:hypothetical protein BC833DRAFT_316432 [Globomyces pollinis-pini]